MGIRENLEGVRSRIARARRNAPDREGPLLLVGVSKGVGIERIREAVASGLSELGENRIQEAREKIPRFPEMRWHLVGHLQRNKAKEAVRLFHLIHSVDSLRLAEVLEKEGRCAGKTVPVLLQVKFQKNPEQFGIPPDEASGLAKKISGLEHISLLGLMTIAPFSEDPEKARPYFRRLRELKEAVAAERFPRVAMRYLSMGMSQDFEVAIEEGANLVRIGRAIFGERHR